MPKTTPEQVAKMPVEASAGAPQTRDALDHDGDGRKGGVAPAPALSHLVVLKDEPARGLQAGEVIAVEDPHVKDLLADDVCRSATETDVSLAQPRVRRWAPAI
jgi:hypothetical protein